MNSGQMQAAVVCAPNEVQIRRVAFPSPREGQVRVRVRGCGVCGSNLAPWEGRPWFKYPLAPGELGHEGWGEVEALGPKVNGLHEGDVVAMLSYHSYAEYDTAPESSVVCLPAAIADKPFPGEALGCAMNVFKRCDIRPEQTVAIVGIGFLGAVLTALCSRAGARVIAISRRPYALSVARTMGAAEAIPMQNHQDILQQVMDLTSGQGCERIIEAVGQQWPLDLAGELTRERGRLIIAGYHQDGPRSVNLQLWNWRGIDVINAHEREPRIYREGVEAAVNAVASGQLDPFPLFTHRFPLDRLSDALNTMQERPDNFLKALVIV